MTMLCFVEKCGNERVTGEAFCTEHMQEDCKLPPIPSDPERETEVKGYDGPPARKPWELWKQFSLAERKLFLPLLKDSAAKSLDEELDREFKKETAKLK